MPKNKLTDFDPGAWPVSLIEPLYIFAPEQNVMN